MTARYNPTPFTGCRLFTDKALTGTSGCSIGYTNTIRPCFSIVSKNYLSSSSLTGLFSCKYTNKYLTSKEKTKKVHTYIKYRGKKHKRQFWRKVVENIYLCIVKQKKKHLKREKRNKKRQETQS